MQQAGIEQFLIGSMNLVSNKINQICSEALIHITFKQWLMLVMMSRMEEEENTLQDVADFCGSSRQNTRRILGVLEERGYCKLTPSKTDARTLLVKITSQGRDIARKESGVVADVISPIFGDLTPEEMNTLVHAMQKVLNKLD